MFSNFFHGEFGSETWRHPGLAFSVSRFGKVVFWNAERCELQGGELTTQYCAPESRVAESGSSSRYPLTNEILQQARSMSGHP